MMGGPISFALKVIESGTPLVFDNVCRKVDIKSLPQEVSRMGANFTVQSYDPATGKIKVDIATGFREGDYGLTTPTRTSYIPTYIHHCRIGRRADHAGQPQRQDRWWQDGY